MTVTVRSDSSSIVGARLTGLHGQRARIVQKTTTADADFTVGRSRPSQKNRVRRVPRETPVDTSTIQDENYLTALTVPSWSKVSDSQALSVALRGKSIVKIRNVAENFNAGTPGVVHNQADYIRGFGTHMNAGRQVDHYDYSSAETDDWQAEQDFSDGNLNSYTFTNDISHVEHKTSFPVDKKYTIINGQRPNQHITQPFRTNYQSPSTNHQLPSVNIQPVNTNFQPVNTYVQPAYTNIQPANTYVQPAYTNIQPVNAYVPPTYTHAQPAYTNIQPVNAYVPSANTNVQPASPNVQPANTYVQPANTHVQPTNANAQPSSTNYLPAKITSSQNQIIGPQNATSMVERLQQLIFDRGEFDWRMIGIIALAKLVLINLKAFAFANLFLFVLFQIKLFAFIVYLKSVVLLRVSKFFNLPIESFINVFFK